MSQMTGIPLCVFITTFLCVGLILAASLHDIATRTIPDGLVLALAATGLLSAVLHGHVLGALIAAGGIFVVSALCWRRGWMGGGDVKLLAAAALGMPPNSILAFAAAVAIAGGLLALLYLLGRRLVHAPASRRPPGMLARAVRVERWRISRGGPLPYACAIAAGALFVNVSGWVP
jgi:prepilin peptidase CpaA